MKKPDFFILGAPKCGTTSLADWLRDHPRIFMCDPKEPHWFNSDSKHHAALNLEHYESFFRKANEQHLAVGEASVWYFVSETAVPNILEYNPDSRFIVCLRNPIEMAPSLHDQKVFSGDETETDFARAWELQGPRKRGELALPSTCMDIRQLLYGDACRLGHQLERLYKWVPRDRVQVTLMDDMRQSPQDIYRSVLDFLDVPDDGRDDFTPSNPAKQRRFPVIRRFQRRLSLLKARLGIKFGTGLGQVVSKLNQIERPRGQMDDATKAMLVEYFRGDIDKCADLINRDLSHWVS